MLSSICLELTTHSPTELKTDISTAVVRVRAPMMTWLKSELEIQLLRLLESPCPFSFIRRLRRRTTKKPTPLMVHACEYNVQRRSWFSIICLCLCLPSSWNRHVDFYWSTTGIRFIWSTTANGHSARRPRWLQRARLRRATARSTRHWRVSSTRLTATRHYVNTWRSSQWKHTRLDPDIWRSAKWSAGFRSDRTFSLFLEPPSGQVPSWRSAHTAYHCHVQLSVAAQNRYNIIRPGYSPLETVQLFSGGCRWICWAVWQWSSTNTGLSRATAQRSTTQRQKWYTPAVGWSATGQAAPSSSGTSV